MEKNIELDEKLKSLQNSLAMSDISTNSNSFSFLVLKLENIKIKIKMYQEKNHLMPHIHIDYKNQNHVASFAIESSIKIEGAINKKYEKIITKWITTTKQPPAKSWWD